MNRRHTPNVDRLFFGFLLACPALFAVGTAPVHADPPEQTEIAKLLPSRGIELGQFGRAVSIDGETLVVGAPNYVPEPTGPGSVYVFNRDAQGKWTEYANLVACDGPCGDGFGRAVAIDGDTIIVGAPAAANSEISGAAYIFTRNEQGDWTQQAKLEVSDPEIKNLGGSVAIEGNTAVVGLISTSVPDVFIFVRDQNGDWSQEATLSAPGTNVTNSLAIQGDTIIIGAPFFSVDDNQTIIGAVYVFTRDENGNWVQQAQLLDPNPEMPYNAFGFSAAFDNNTVAIGSLTFSVSRAYIFDRNEQGDWLMQQVLDPDGNSSRDNFGASVAIQGDTLVVGASHDSPSGSAHIFTRDARGIWLEQAKLLQSDGGNNDNFGAAVALDDDTIIVGARGDDDNGRSSGSAYVFDADGSTGAPATLTDFTVLDGTLISGGLPRLRQSDDRYLETEARVTGEASETHRMLMRIRAMTAVENPDTINITLEAHVTDIEAIVTLFLRNFDTGLLEQVGQFTNGLGADTTNTVNVPNASRFVRPNGRIVLRVKKIVILPFTLGGFHSLEDLLEIRVR